MTHLLPWQVISSTIVHKTPWIEVKEDVCTTQERELTYTYTHRVDEGPLILAQEQDGRLWMVRQYRHPIHKIIWQFPAEGMYPGETWVQTAKRGLYEELQLEASQWIDLGVYHPDPGGLDQMYHAFLAQDLHAIPNADLSHLEHEVEELETHAFTRDEINTLIDTGEICDNWTLAGLFLLDRYRKQTS